MALVRPFRALFYHRETVGDLARVIAPPYDVIDRAAVDRLYERSPHNVVRLILNRAPDRYVAAAADFQAWRKSGVLVRDAVPCLYYYVQEFARPGGERVRRSGLMAAVRLEPFSAGVIRPHERTLAPAKADRLRLMRACGANLSPVFGLFGDPNDLLAPLREWAERTAAWIDVTDDVGERHLLWRVPEGDLARTVTAALAGATVFIADGHHRYETALAYRDEMRVAGCAEGGAQDFVLMYLNSMRDPGLVVLPTHRVLSRAAVDPGTLRAHLEKDFSFEAMATDEDTPRRLVARLDREDGTGCFGLRLAGEGRTWLIRLHDPGLLDATLPEIDPAVRRLDASVLDAFVLRRTLGMDCTLEAKEGRLRYVHDDDEAFAAVAGCGEAAAVFFLRSPRLIDVEAVCMSGQTMPEKSTFFFPKLATGLVFHPLEGE